MKKIIFLIIVYPFRYIQFMRKNLSKNEVFDVLSKWEGKRKTSVVLRNLFGYLKDMKPEELQIQN